MKKAKKATHQGKSNHLVWVCLGVCVVVALIGIFFAWGLFSNASPTVQGGTGQTPKPSPTIAVAVGNDLTISKSDITNVPLFVPHKIGNTNLEVIALKASDGTIKTAFNTCQVCYSSGRGYYKVQGTKLECQNCGNLFGFDEVGLQKGGCNPVAIIAEDRSETESQIVISKQYLQQAEKIFKKWKS